MDDTSVTTPDNKNRASGRASPSPSSRSLFGRPSPALSPSSPSSPPRRDRPFSQHNRRLQLRNAGFRGAQLLQRRVSPGGSGCVGSVSAATKAHPDERDEGNNNTRNRRPSDPSVTTPPQSRPRCASNILQEIERSTRRHKTTSQRPSVTALFQSSRPSSPGDYQQRQQLSSSPSYRDITGLDETMNPKDGSSSLRSRFSSLNQPKRREASSHVSKRDTSRYIEHLESQLAESLTRADTLDSSVSAAHASKVKSLTAELRVLKQELTEWEGQFEVRVQDELASMVERESQFRARIRALEKDVELKDSKAQELEWELEMGNRRLRSMDALKSTNRNLERRVDVLTELLAQSQNKTDTTEPVASHDPDISSPQSNKSTPRPKSMFSKMPLSPIRRPLSQPLNEPPSISGVLEEGGMDADIKEPDPFGHSRGLSNSSIPTSDLDSGLGSSQPSTTGLESQRSSMISQSSSASSLWRTSFPLSPDFQGKLQQRQKRMRCFPSGSSTLKPLVLPATTSTSPPSGSVSSPTRGGEAVLQRRRDTISDDLFPTESSPAGAHEDTLNALEGNSHQYQTFEEAISGHIMAESVDGEHNSFDDHDVGFQQLGFYDTGFSTSQEPPGDTSIGSIGLPHREPRRLSIANSAKRRRRPRGRDVTLHPDGFRPSPKNPPFPATAAPGLSWLPILYIKDIFTHCGTIARRILVHAWHSHWRKFRKLSWWILGFLLGKPCRNAWFASLPTADSACASWDSANGANMRSKQELANSPGTPSPASRALSGTRLSVQGSTRSPANISRLNVEDTTSPIYLVSHHPLSRSVQLWAKFSFALVLAVGLAIRDGPGSLMCDCAGQITSSADSHPTVPGLDPPIRLTPKHPRYPTGEGSVEANTVNNYKELEADEDDNDARFPADGINSIGMAGALET